MCRRDFLRKKYRELGTMSAKVGEIPTDKHRLFLYGGIGEDSKQWWGSSVGCALAKTLEMEKLLR